LGKSECPFWRCEEPWRSIGESETVEFESAIKRVFKVVSETVIFNCYWGVNAFMYGNFRKLEDSSKELSCQVS